MDYPVWGCDMTEYYSAWATLSASFITPIMTSILDKINTTNSQAEKKLFSDIKIILDRCVELNNQLQDSEFIRNKNLSLALYSKFYEKNMLYDNKPFYAFYLHKLYYVSDNNSDLFDTYSNIPKYDTDYDKNKESFIRTFNYIFRKQFLEALKFDINLEIKVPYRLKHRDLIKKSFQILQTDDYLKIICGDSEEKFIFFKKHLKLFEGYYST